MEMNDRVIRKTVGKLIEVLHGEYSDTRDLAVVQLALLGGKAVPYILSFLKKEGDLERDFINLHKICRDIDSKSYGGPESLLEKAKEEKEKFRQYFEKKWGREIRDSDLPSRDPLRFDQRKEAVNRALEALAIIGDLGVIPTLKTLPIHDWEIRIFGDDVGPLFEKAKETIDKIQSA